MRRKNNESGAILAIVIIFMFAVTITGLAFLNSTVMEYRLAMREVHKNQAFYLAEGGVEDARFKLGDNWDLASIDETSLGNGIYMADIYETDEDGDPLDPDNDSKRRIRSTGTVKEISQIVQVVVIKPPTGAEIKAALETSGEVRIRGTATITGDLEHSAIIAEAVDPKGNYIIEPPEDEGGISISPPCIPGTAYLNCFTASEYPPYEDYFEYVFKMKKSQVKDLANSGAGGNTYYSTFVRDPEDVTGITWIDDPDGVGSRITSMGWHGDGILVVNGDLTITGGTFDGILWVIGTLEIGAGNPVINGAVVVESDITESIPLEGKLEVNYDREKINLAVGEVATLPFIELGTWEQLK